MSAYRIVLTLLLFESFCDGAPSRQEILAVSQNLQKMVQEDQGIRGRLKGLIKENPNHPELSELTVKMAEIDRRNTQALKEVIEKWGWPVITVFGEEADHSAWLLVQHADHDIAFQKKCLRLLKRALRKKDTSPQNIAYLTDRIAVNEKRPQRFGTQGNINNATGCWEPATLEDPQHTDKWRAQYGLEPFDEYRRLVNEYSGHPECNRK